MKNPLSELTGVNVAKTSADGNPAITDPVDPPEGLNEPVARVVPAEGDAVGFAVLLLNVNAATPLVPMSE